MFWRNKRFFRQLYFVAISLFNNLGLYKIAKVDYRHPNFQGLYAIRCDRDGGNKQLGWAYVSKYDTAAASWNDDMRKWKLTYAIWHEGRPYQWRTWDEPHPPHDQLDPVQVCAVYDAQTKYEREAANEAWDKVRVGDPTHIEWYDASPDRKWTMMFGLAGGVPRS